MRVAVIGTGISGSLVARLLSTRHEVSVFEANQYVGGHANTVDVRAFGRTYQVDTGFMVFNRRTYPNFCRLLELLNVASQPSDMSFSVRCAKTGLEYQGSSLNGLFAQRANCLRPKFFKMLMDIVRFNRRGTECAQAGLRDQRTVGQFVEDCGLGKTFVDNYLVPMAAAIWSSRPQAILEFPADFMLGFFANHGLMQLRDRPAWRTVTGGSRVYVGALLGPIRDRLRLGCPVTSVHRSTDAVVVETASHPAEAFDEVVFAAHADQTLNMLADPTPAEREVLTAFPYQANQAVLHTDTRLLPKRRRAWASWNYHITNGAAQSAAVTYDLSRLQSLDTPGPLLLTLNDPATIDPTCVLRRFSYQHPAFTAGSFDAQRKFATISCRRRTHFCGAYWGYGFHEDGVNSALAVARKFDLELDQCVVASTKERSPMTVVCQ